MGSKVRSIEKLTVPGGIELRARSHSNRGTTYIIGRVLVKQEDLSKADFRLAVARGVEELMSSGERLG